MRKIDGVTLVSGVAIGSHPILWKKAGGETCSVLCISRFHNFKARLAARDGKGRKKETQFVICAKSL
jgi:hypothetical protein